MNSFGDATSPLSGAHANDLGEPVEADMLGDESRADFDHAVAALEEHAVLMPHSLTMPRLQHISNNMCNEVHTALPHFSEYWIQLKALETLLVVPERRSRYI